MHPVEEIALQRPWQSSWRRTWENLRLEQIPSQKLPVQDSETMITRFKNYRSKPNMIQHAIVFFNLTAFPCEAFVSRLSYIFLKPLPSQSPTCNSFLNFTASPFQGFWSRFQVIFNTAPQSPICNSIPPRHSFTFRRVLVTSQSHFYQIVFLNFSASRFPGFLSRFQVMFKTSPCPKTYIQKYSQLYSFTFSRVLIKIPSSF